MKKPTAAGDNPARTGIVREIIRDQRLRDQQEQQQRARRAAKIARAAAAPNPDPNDPTDKRNYARALHFKKARAISKTKRPLTLTSGFKGRKPGAMPPMTAAERKRRQRAKGQSPQ